MSDKARTCHLCGQPIEPGSVTRPWSVPQFDWWEPAQIAQVHPACKDKTIGRTGRGRGYGRRR